VIVWDEKKRESNLRKHGLDFVDAHLVYDNPSKITRKSERMGEERDLDTVLVEHLNSILAWVYTQRGEDIRAISFRYASRKERDEYAETKQQD
jgi:uncharacterized DUF497 family protein